MLPRPPFVPLMRAFLTALYIPTLLWTGGPAMRAQAQAALDLPRETFTVADRPAFVMLPAPEKRTAPQPWVFYAPTLPAYPDEAERWMHERFLEAGIAIAGVDVGEAYGSPERSHPAFAALYENLIAQRGFASKPCLLGRSRGGLWVSSWALAHPEKAAGLAGIYPVFDLRSYPKLEAAAPAYALTPAELENRLSEFNPVARLAQLARARLPAFLISGDEDTVVPLEANSAEFVRHYKEAGVGDLVTLVVIKGQGHNFFEGFFKSQELVDFAISRARAGAKPASPNKTPAPSPGVRRLVAAFHGGASPAVVGRAAKHGSAQIAFAADAGPRLGTTELSAVVVRWRDASTGRCVESGDESPHSRISAREGKGDIAAAAWHDEHL